MGKEKTVTHLMGKQVTVYLAVSGSVGGVDKVGLLSRTGVIKFADEIRIELAIGNVTNIIFWDHIAIIQPLES